MSENIQALEDNELQSALRKRMVALLEAPMTPRMLLMLENLARKAREILSIGNEGAALIKTCYNSDIGPVIGGSDFADGQVSYNSSENYGSAFARELISAVGAITQPRPPSTAELVLAIDSANRLGLSDVVENLKSQLPAAPQLPAESENQAGAAI